MQKPPTLNLNKIRKTPPKPKGKPKKGGKKTTAPYRFV